jgi:hypothetical protein
MHIENIDYTGFFFLYFKFENSCMVFLPQIGTTGLCKKHD